MTFTVYIIQSEIDNSYYIGFTSSLEKRLKQHNVGESTYTSRKIPWKIVYAEIFNTKTAAIKRERFLKNQKSITFIRMLIESGRWVG